MAEHDDEQTTLLRFPCSFPIKVMGYAEDDFDSLVVSIVRKHVNDLYEAAVSSRLSQGGRYLAITITIDAQSQEQLDAIYHELSSHERVLMAL
jgi:uncharacterized protein